jgi:hypothetical protein
MMPTVFARATSQRELPAFRPVFHYHPDLVNQVLAAVDNSMEIEISYFYNGALGNDGVIVSATPLKSDGSKLNAGQHGGLLLIVGRKAMVRLELTYFPKKETSPHGIQSTSIALSIGLAGSVGVYFKEFTCDKMWKPT